VKRPKVIAVMLMVAAAATTWLLMYRATGWHTPFDIMMLWSLAPYVLFAVYALSPRKRYPADAAARASFWACFAVFGYTLASYLHASFLSRSSTSGLVFIGAPLWALLGGLVLGERLLVIFARRAARAR
jgi:hypothetical protein